ncbi:MAG: Ig-like domain-containing protein [Christensenellales bacterium]
MYDLKVTNVPTANVYLSVGSHQLGVDTNAGAVNWTSSADEIATVDSTGLVTFHTTGSVNITVTPTDADRAPLAKTVTLNIAEESVQIIDERSEIAWRSLPDSKQITVAVAYSPNLTLNWSVDEGSAGYATVSQDGVVTFLEAGRYHDVTINVSATTAAGGTLSDSITFTLTDPVTALAANGVDSVTYGYGEESDTVLISTTGTSDSWRYNVRFQGIAANAKPVADYRNNGYKYVKLNIYFNENVKQFRMDIHLNTDGKGPRYEKYIDIGSTPDSDVYFYDATTGGRITDAIATGKWYTLFIPTDYSAYNGSWAEAGIGLNATSGTAVMKVKDMSFVKEISGVHDLAITGVRIGMSNLKRPPNFNSEQTLTLK